jgi:hypothetical protein
MLGKFNASRFSSSACPDLDFDRDRLPYLLATFASLSICLPWYSYNRAMLTSLMLLFFPASSAGRSKNYRFLRFYGRSHERIEHLPSGL